MIPPLAGEPRGLALLLTDAGADASFLPGTAVAAVALAAAAYASPLIPTAYASRAVSLLPRAAAVAAPAAWYALKPTKALAEAAVVGGQYGLAETLAEVRGLGLTKQDRTGANRPPRGLTPTQHPGERCQPIQQDTLLWVSRTLAAPHT